eukprot:3941721-Rhodomonas_salina.3
MLRVQGLSYYGWSGYHFTRGAAMMLRGLGSYQDGVVGTASEAGHTLCQYQTSRRVIRYFSTGNCVGPYAISVPEIA